MLKPMIEEEDTKLDVEIGFFEGSNTKSCIIPYVSLCKVHIISETIWP